MSDDLVTPENVSKAFLQELFNDALMDVSVDSDGDLVIQEDIVCYVFLSENQERIRLLTLFGIAENADRLKCLECVNAINSEYLLVKAYIESEKTLAFEYDIYLKGGVTRKYLALAVKRFCNIPRKAVAEEYALGIIP
ncbi:MAG: YbjN domain-containing protein [Oscillatoriales cyanobacterium]|nr:MAG: YbjN domain-containing protein [Oscillatoriales cyanobacterium]